MRKYLLHILIMSFVFLHTPVIHSADEEKGRLLVVPLKAQKGIDQNEAALLTNILSVEIYKSGMFSILNRDDMKAMLTEKEFELAMGCNDNVCLLENVEKLAVNKIITGNIGKLGTKYIISIRLVNEDGHNEVMVKESCDCEIEELEESIERIAYKFLSYIGGEVASSGSIRVGSEPGGARIFLDGVDIGTTPYSIRYIVPGKHMVEIKMDGYKVWSKKVRVKAGKEKVLIARLKSEGTKILDKFLFRAAKQGEAARLVENEKRRQKEKEKKLQVKWSEWQKEFDSAYDKALKYDIDTHVSAGEKAQIWQNLSDRFCQENPYSTKDQMIRSKAILKVKYWKSYKEPVRQAPVNKHIGTRPNFEVKDVNKKSGVEKVETGERVRIRGKAEEHEKSEERWKQKTKGLSKGSKLVVSIPLGMVIAIGIFYFVTIYVIGFFDFGAKLAVSIPLGIVVGTSIVYSEILFSPSLSMVAKLAIFMPLGMLGLIGIVHLGYMFRLGMNAGHINTDRIPTSTASQTHMVFVKGGNFDMGEIYSYAVPKDNEEPVHEVYVDDFYIGKYEVTQGLWKEVMGNNPSHFKDYGDILPVESVSWIDVQEFLKKLNQKTGLSYRLPTEAEWEYASRGGGEGLSYSGTNSKTKLGSYAWYDNYSWPAPINTNACGETHSVGQKKPNGLGLYDMSGNVWEWCSDWYDAEYYGKSPKNNPQGPPGGSLRICRGGSWDLTARYLLNIRRGSKRPDSASHDLGFRLARTR